MEKYYRLRTLGVPSLEGPSGRIDGPAARAQSLVMLGRIAVAGDAGVSRDALVGLLWPDSPTELGRRSLSNLVYQVRRSLGAEAVENRQLTLHLPPDRWDVDLWTLKKAPGAEAVVAYRGRFLEGIRVSVVEAERWIEKERDAAARLYLDALETLAREAGEVGNAAQAVHWWQRAVHEDPLHSARTCELMLWLARSGDPAGALRLSGQHAERRRGELGLGPDSAVTLLADQIGEGNETVLEYPQSERSNVRQSEPAYDPIGEYSVAVMPFRDLTIGPPVPHLAQGLSIALSHRLAGAKGLRVAAASAVAALSEGALTDAQIADSLGVRFLLEGTVRRFGDHIQLTAQLVDTRTGTQEWSERHTGTMEELLAIEEHIEAAVARRFRMAPGLVRSESASRSVHEDYLRGLFLESHFRWDQVEQAARAFTRVVEGAPDYALGRTALARVLVATSVGVPTRDVREALKMARECADRATELAPDSGDAYAALGLVQLFGDWDLPGARRSVYHATSLSIHDSMALTWAALTLSLSGDAGAAAALADEATERDPFGYAAEFTRCWIARHAGALGEKDVQALVRRRPDGLWGQLLLALTVPDDVERVTALTEFVFDMELPPSFPVTLAVAARAQAGNHSDVPAALRASEQGAREGETRHTERALLLSASGRGSEGGDALVRALRAREPNALFLWRDPLLRGLRERREVVDTARVAGLSSGTGDSNASTRRGSASLPHS